MYVLACQIEVCWIGIFKSQTHFDLRSVRFNGLHCSSEFASIDFMQRAYSFFAICSEIRAQILGWRI